MSYGLSWIQFIRFHHQVAGRQRTSTLGLLEREKSGLLDLVQLGHDISIHKPPSPRTRSMGDLAWILTSGMDHEPIWALKIRKWNPIIYFCPPYHITYPIHPYMIIKWRRFLVTAQRFSFRSSQSDSYHWRKPLGAGGLVRCNGQVSDGLPPDLLHDICSHPAHRFTQILREKAPHLSVEMWWAGGQPHVISKSIAAVSPTNHPQLEVIALGLPQENLLNPLDRRVAAAAVPNKHTWSRLWRILGSVGR